MLQTIGQQLKQARSARGLSIEQAARALHIRPKYIEALEEDHRKELPSPVQGKGFLRMYAEFLALPVQPLLDTWDGKLPPPASLPPEISGPAAEIAEETYAPSAMPDLPQEEPIAPEMLPLPETAPVIEVPQPALLAAAPPLDTPSQTSFVDIGRLLQRQREALGLSLPEVERYTHVRAHYLQALEAGRLDHLPSPVQGRGMLSNYARFLNLDVESVLLQFAEGLQTSRLERREIEKPAKSTPRRPAARPAPAKTGPRRLLSRDLFISTFLVVIILGFALWTAAQVDALNSQATSAPPSIADVLLSNPTGTSTPTTPANLSTLAPGEVKSGPPGAVTAQPATTLTIPVGGSGPLQVYVVARMRAFLRITIDGKVAFEGRVAPGAPYPFSGEKKIELLTGNAAALQIFFNQKDLGTTGQMGQVKALIFTKDGAITPTPQFTATRTRTVQPPSTLQPSPTLPASTITPFVP